MSDTFLPVGGRTATPSRRAPLRIEFGDAGVYDELRRFREAIFRDELGIQHTEYQDVFNDYVSKNITLRRDSLLEGAVRLAFSRDTGRFFISYLCVRSSRRNDAAHVGLLLGAIFHLMRENDIRSVHGHAADENLPMYVQAGCRPIGGKFRKYGFDCEWTPIEYVAGTNPGEEERLVARVRERLDRDGARWSFTLRVVLCRDPREFAEALRRLISTGEIFGTIPHLGERLDMRAMASPYVHEIELVAAADLYAGNEPDFDVCNGRFDGARVIAVRAGDPFGDVARTYAMLHGRRLVTVGEWGELSREHGLRDVAVIAGPDDRESVDAARVRFDGCRWRAAFAATASEMSSLLLAAHLRGLGPADVELPI